MSMVSEQYRYVVGVDTHAASHSYAIIACPVGGLVDQQEFPTSPAGLARARAWVARRCGDPAGVLISAEGTGSYGAVLARGFTQAGYRVVEAPTPARARLRQSGKTDTLDALTAAVACLRLDPAKLSDVRADGPRLALQVLTTLRDQLNAERLRCINAVTALARSHDLGLDARRKLTKAQIRQIAAWRDRDEPVDVHLARTTATRHAHRILTLDTELAANYKQIHQIVTQLTPGLLGLYGVGPISAAAILVVWSHPGRIHNQAAFAKLAGTSPIPISSGNTHRHRLNRAGDRRLNRAIATITLTRWRSDPTTRAYAARRTAEGKQDRDIRRCIRRYTTRQIYRYLNATMA